MKRRGNGNEWGTIGLDGENDKDSRGRNMNYLIGLSPGVWGMIQKRLVDEWLSGGGETGV